MKGYTEADVKALTIHVYARAIAVGAMTVEDARARVVKMLEWLVGAGWRPPSRP